MSTTAVASNASQINRTVVYVSLGLAILLVLGVLGGARYYFNKVALQPVAMTELPSPLADSAECSAFVNAAPDKVLGLKRAEIAEPAPAGVAAWQASSTQRITMRCGVDMPLQYTAYTPTEDHAGGTWMRINDMTPGSTMVSWFSTDRSPVIAITTDEATLGRHQHPLDAFDVSALPQVSQPQNPAPLSQLDTADIGDTASAQHCDALLDAMPESIADGYNQLPDSAMASPNTVGWTAPGHEPIVVRCGVTDPTNYAAGAALQQINEIPWFEDTVLANGTTSSTWYALGREVNIAAFLPQSEGNEAITTLSTIIAQHVPAE